MKPREMFEVMKAGYKANKPGVKSAGAIILTFVAVGTAAKAGAKTVQVTEKMKYEGEDMTPKEKAAEIIPLWIEPAVATGLAVWLIYSSYKESSKIIAALGAGYMLKDNAYKDLSEKVEEIAGKKKKEDIEEAIRIDKVRNNPPVEGKILETGHGDSLCYDVNAGLPYFRANKDFVDNAFLKIQNELDNKGYASWSDLLYEMNRIEKNRDGEFLNGDILDNLGWKGDNLNVKYSSTLADDGTPVLVIDYTLPYSDFFC